MLYQLLLPTEPKAAEEYLARAEKLIKDVIRECGTPAATLRNGKVNFGEGGWETILQVSQSSESITDRQHSTINGNERATKRLMDHGLICKCHATAGWIFMGVADL